MKKGQILTKNKELERYLATTNPQKLEKNNVEGFHVSSSFSISWFHDILISLLSGSWWIITRNILVISYLFSYKCRLYLLSHGLSSLDVSVSLAEFILQFILGSLLLFLSFATLPSSLAAITIATTFIFPCLCGFFVAYIFNSVTLLGQSSSQLTLVTLKLLHKLQISLLGRDLLYPLPPYFKYEEYLTQYQERCSGPVLSVPGIRKTVYHSLIKLRKILQSSQSSLSNRDSFCFENSSRILRDEMVHDPSHLTLSSLHDLSQIVFQSLLPSTLSSVFSSFMQHLSTPILSWDFICQLIGIFSTLITIHNSIRTVHQDLLALTLPSPNYPLHEMEKIQLEAIPEDAVAQYISIRKKFFEIKTKYEANLQRLWLSELELANLLPLLVSHKTESAADSLERTLTFLRGGDAENLILIGKDWEIIEISQLDELCRMVESLYMQIPSSSKIDIQRSVDQNHSSSLVSSDELLDESDEALKMANEEYEERARLARLQHLYLSDGSSNISQKSQQFSPDDNQTIIVHTGRVLSQQELDDEIKRQEDDERRSGIEQIMITRKLMKELLPHVKLIQEKASEYEKEKWADGRDESALLEQNEQDVDGSPSPHECVFPPNPQRTSQTLFASLLQQSIPSRTGLAECTLGDVIEDD